MTSPVVPFGKPRAERADAARNREQLLEAVREIIAEQGAEAVTMDGLAERAGLGKGTVFRRFGTRAGIFKALLDADERRFQEHVLSGLPPLGPGADPVARLVAYGRARIAFLVDNQAVARAALDSSQPVPAGAVPFSQPHIRMLLGQADVRLPSLDGLAIQLTAALEAPLLLFLSASDAARPSAAEMDGFLGDSWQALIERVAR